jgi:hypothetical protein
VPFGNVAKEAQSICLVTPFMMLQGMRQGALGEGVRLLQTAGQQLRFSQGETTERLEVHSFRRSVLLHRLREQRHDVTDAPAQSVRRSQGRSHPGEIDWEVHVPTDAHSPIEEGECPWQVALPEGQQTDSLSGKHQAAGVIDRLCDPQPFFAEGTTFGELPQLGIAVGEGGSGEYGGQGDLAEPLAVPCSLDGRHGPCEAVDRPTIVALGLVGGVKVAVRPRLQDDIAAGCGEREGALSGGDGLFIRAHDAAMN